MISDIKRWLRHNLLLKILALIVGTAVWFVASRWVYETSTLVLPVELTLAAGMTLKSVSPPAVTVTLEYPRESYELIDRGNGEIKVVHDLTKTRTPGRIVFNLQDKDVERPPRVRVAGLNPSRITAEVDRLVEKVLPVKVVYRGPPRRGYRVTGQRVIPPEVRVPGPESLLDTMTEIETEPVSVTGREITFDIPSALKPLNLYSREKLQEVRVIVYLGPELKKRTFKGVGVELLRPFGQTGEIQMVPRKVDLYLKGPEGALEAMTSDDLRVYVDIVGLKPGPWQLPLQTVFPAGVVLERAEPAIIKVTLEQGPGALLGP
ncbi:MAG: CdaR family protein [Candidatus Euphemobacter frigidus]|nr:CdaR family protein [Candidatus Euphemobacter frigidus]MDP8275735.1 CdaR family protein [Candidatus Euphemobacter frigidus]